MADSFTLGAADYVNSFEFIGLSDPGSTLQSVQYYLSDSYFSSPIAGPAQTVSLVAGTDLGDYTIGGTSYDLKDYTLSTGSDLLSAGTYYLNLTDGVSSDSGYAAVFDQLYGTSDAYREYVNGASISGPYTAGSDTLSAYGNPAPEMSTFSSMLLSAGSLAALVGLSLRRRKSLI